MANVQDLARFGWTLQYGVNRRIDNVRQGRSLQHWLKDMAPQPHLSQAPPPLLEVPPPIDVAEEYPEVLAFGV
jgi:hypothetical protein